MFLNNITKRHQHHAECHSNLTTATHIPFNIDKGCAYFSRSLHSIWRSLQELYYPYYSLYSNFTLLVDTFHLTSVFLTSCLGMQKVIFFLFLIWSMNYLTIQKSIVCCVLCFIIPIAITLPSNLILNIIISCLDIGVNGEVVKLLQSCWNIPRYTIL